MSNVRSEIEKGSTKKCMWGRKYSAKIDGDEDKCRGQNKQCLASALRRSPQIITEGDWNKIWTEVTNNS